MLLLYCHLDLAIYKCKQPLKLVQHEFYNSMHARMDPFCDGDHTRTEAIMHQTMLCLKNNCMGYIEYYIYIYIYIYNI